MKSLMRTLSLGLAAAFAWVAAANAQTTLQPPSLLQQGVGAAAYGRCQVDVLTGDLQRSAAALGALAPAVVRRLLPGPDEITVLAMMCGHQLHQHRCSARIVAAAGNVMASAYPGNKVVPPQQVNPGALLGATAGGLAGLVLGSNNGLGTAVGAAAIGGYLGAKGGESVWSHGEAAACMARQRQLDAITSQLQGSLRGLSVASLTALIEANIRARTLSQQDAALIVDEANRLMAQAQRVLAAAR